jgi:hypothetical protein
MVSNVYVYAAFSLYDYTASVIMDQYSSSSFLYERFIV